jgi:cobalt-precorrin-6B (C15)-methyltransferase
MMGISDDAFIRGSIPMTKSEVRVISLSKLRLKEDGKVLDIGCGTGSVTVECASLCSKGRVIAIDQNEEAVYLTKENIKKFEQTNVEIIHGSAPLDLPSGVFDHIFLGGASKVLEEVIAYASAHLKEEGTFVANAILLESVYTILEALKKEGFKEIECTLVQVAKGEEKTRWMMRALNPIYIISATK